MVKCDFCKLEVGDTIWDGKKCKVCGAVMHLKYKNNTEYELVWEKGEAIKHGRH